MPNIDGSPSYEDKLSVEYRQYLHGELMKSAYKHLEAAKASLILAASVSWIDTNPMTTKIVDKCIEILKGYVK